MTTTMIDKRVAARLLRLRDELADTAGHLQTRANTGVPCACHHGQLCEAHARAYRLMMEAEEALDAARLGLLAIGCGR